MGWTWPIEHVWCLAVLPAAPVAAGMAGQPPTGDPDHILQVESERVVAVFSDSIRAEESGIRAWLRLDYPVPPDAPEGVRRRWVHVLGYFDCTGRRWRVAEVVERSGSEPETEWLRTHAWQPVSGLPAAEVALEYVCNYSGPATEPGEIIYLM